ncbi:MAG: HNH endonuclease [Methylobacter sp.]
MARKPIPQVVQADVVIKSKRRCALCVGLDGNTSERPGQIAHLNGDHSDNRFENLVWLCLEHHDKFDSTTSQTKNYTQLEVRNHRDKLYQMYSSSKYSPEDIELARKYLKEYATVFTYIFHEYSELAFKIDHNVMDSLAEIRDFWHTNTLRSFNSSIRELQDHIANNIVGILSIYELNMYDWVGDYIKFDNHRFSPSILQQKKEEAKSFPSVSD